MFWVLGEREEMFFLYEGRKKVGLGEVGEGGKMVGLLLVYCLVEVWIVLMSYFVIKLVFFSVVVF